MDSSEPPEDYEGLIRLIHERYDGMSKSYQRIAEFLTQNPNDVAVMSVNAIASSCGIHASNFVRFAQAFGYKGFKDLQALFQKRLSTAATGFEARRRALNTDLAKSGEAGAGQFLSDLVLRDIASLEDMLTRIAGEDIQTAAEMLDRAETVYLVGQLRAAPVVMLLHYILTMLGKKNVMLDESGGLATHHAKLATEKDMLFAVSFRFYATEVVNIAEQTARRGVPILAISDSTLSPLAKTADLLFAVPEQEYTFARSLAGPICLAQSISVALASLMQNRASPRIPIVTQP